MAEAAEFLTQVLDLLVRFERAEVKSNRVPPPQFPRAVVDA